jgi:hypothetical protein
MCALMLRNVREVLEGFWKTVWKVTPMQMMIISSELNYQVLHEFPLT